MLIEDSFALMSEVMIFMEKKDISDQKKDYLNHDELKRKDIEQQENKLLGNYFSTIEYEEEIRDGETLNSRIRGALVSREPRNEKQDPNKKVIPTELSSENINIDDEIRRVIEDAESEKATDIHIDEVGGLSRIRYRVDGKLKLSKQSTRYPHKILTQRLKVMGEFFLREDIKIQKGKVNVRLSNNTVVQYTLQTLPSNFSDVLVLRKNSSTKNRSIDQLGMTYQDLRTIEVILERKSGLVFVGGFSGSGRSTTLYALLNRLISKEKQIISIEDRVDDRVEGATQLSLEGFKDIPTVELLDELMEFDMDVLFVDIEIDKTLTRKLIQIALGGKLVICTTYFPSAIDTIKGLMSMGVEPYSIAASLAGIVCQIMVRKSCVCKNKKKDKEDSEEERKKQNDVMQNEDKKDFFTAMNNEEHKGFNEHEEDSLLSICPICSGSGYKNKIPIFEIFRMNRTYWSLILNQEDHEELKKSLENERCSFSSNAKRTYESGLTTIEELVRIGLDPKLFKKP